LPTNIVLSPRGVFPEIKNANQAFLAFFSTMLPYAAIASEKMGGKVPPEAIAAHWALESKNGRALSSKFNYGGIKAAAKPGEEFEWQLTEEFATPSTIEGWKKAEGPKGPGTKYVESYEFGDKMNKPGHGMVDAWRWYGKTPAMKPGMKLVRIWSKFKAYKDFKDFAEQYGKLIGTERRYQRLREATSPYEYGNLLGDERAGGTGYMTSSGAGKTIQELLEKNKSEIERLKRETSTSNVLEEQKTSSLGNTLNDMSSNNSDMRRNMASLSPTVIIAPQTNTNRNTTRSAPASQPNVNPMLGR
jgi:hypothetical protein